MADEPLEEFEPGGSDGKGEERGGEDVRGRGGGSAPTPGFERHAIKAAVRKDTERPGTRVRITPTCSLK